MRGPVESTLERARDGRTGGDGWGGGSWMAREGRCFLYLDLKPIADANELKAGFDHQEDSGINNK